MLFNRPILATVLASLVVGCTAERSPSPEPSAEGPGSLVLITRYQNPPPGTPISIGGYAAFADLRGPAGLLEGDIELALGDPLHIARDVQAGDYRLSVRILPVSDAISVVNGVAVRDFGPVTATCDAFLPVLAGETTAAVVTVVGGESCTIDMPNAALVTTLTPTSAAGAEIGVPQRFDMPHCGIKSPIDFDGSFWDPILVDPASLEFDNASGTIRLTDTDTALFVSSTGSQLRLVRHTGDKVFLLCD